MATNPCLHFSNRLTDTRRGSRKKEKKYAAKKRKKKNFSLLFLHMMMQHLPQGPHIVADDLLRRSEDVPITHSLAHRLFSPSNL
jgi:hypothetical protein